MKPLCDILGISVSELLSGECLNEEQEEGITDNITIDLTKIIEGMREQKRTLLFIIIGVLVMNLGERLPDLLLINREMMNSQFFEGTLAGASAAMIILGIALFGAGFVLFVKEHRNRL